MELTQRKFLFLITVGVATWVAAMATGQLIVLATGIPASSGLLNGFLVPFLLVLGALIARAKLSITIAFGVYGALATFTVLLGPPGAHKIIVAVISGLIADGVFYLCHNKFNFSKVWSYAVSFFLWGASLAGTARVLFELLQLPGKEEFLELFWAMTAVFVVGAVIGSAAATALYKKRDLDKNPLVKRLHSDE